MCRKCGEKLGASETAYRFGERLPSEEVLRNLESVEVELGGLRLLWDALENLTGEDVERVRLTAAMGAATVVVIVDGVPRGGYQGGVNKRGERVCDGQSRRKATRAVETKRDGLEEDERRGRGEICTRARRKIRGGVGARLLWRVVNLSKHDMQAEEMAGEETRNSPSAEFGETVGGMEMDVRERARRLMHDAD
jgi:hypothetical protein